MSSHRRRRGLRGRSLPALSAAALLLAAVCAAAGIAWDPFTADARQGTASAPVIGTPWSAGPDPGEGSPSPGATGPTPTAPGGSSGGQDAGTTPGAGDAGAGRPAGALPFDLPGPAALRTGGAAKKLVFAHYFTPYPLSLDNASADADYYTRNYLNPAGENGKHERYGGLLRDRPLPVQPKGGNWERANLEQEVRTARAAGLDGFTLDMLSLSGPNRDRAQLLMEAAHAVDPGFKIMLMPDMTSLNTDDPGVLADAVAALGKAPAAHRLGDGRLVVSPSRPRRRASPGGRRSSTCSGPGTASAPPSSRRSSTTTPTAHGSRRSATASPSGGSRSYVGQESATRDVQRAHGMGKIWMQPVSVQDARPNQGVYDEAGNTATLRSTWTHAIDDGADWVQLTTWNDYSEGSQFAPSLHNGYAYLDLSSYYLTKFKTGSWPKIVRDTLYVSARTQFAAADPTGAQSLVMSLRKGSAAPRDTVEVLSFLKAPATVRTLVGTAEDAHEAPAGIHSELLPLRPGTSSAAVVRDGKTGAEVKLPYAADGTVSVQDLQYHAVTSGRD